ncbi:MAG: ribosomal protein S18-alanine N-acetyltransferase [Lachnospiraceae bacterium]
MDDVIFRKMRKEDLPQVAALEADCFSCPWRLQDFADALEKDCYYYMVAQHGGKIVAQAGLILSLGEADITNVAVTPSYRRKQISYRLLQHLMVEGEKRGVLDFTLEVRQHNAPALALYQKLGFVSEGVRRNFYTNPTDDAVIMWKRHMEKITV